MRVLSNTSLEVKLNAVRIATLLLPLWAGCTTLIPSDGAFRVAGSLPKAAGVCELLLMPAEGKDTPLDTAKIAGNFERTFVVPSSAADYRVAVVCASKVRKVITVRYGIDVKSGQVAYLGNIPI
jgi:hypothetical protein